MSARVRGFAEWTPRANSRQLLDQVQSVLDEYAEYLPLTVRQVFYRLVGSRGYDKTELAYDRLGELLNRARRAGKVDFDAIRDGGVTAITPLAFTSRQHFIDTAKRLAANYKMDRQTGQSTYLELWVEAAGMAPMLAAAVDEFGVPVYSCGGFDSLTAKYDAAQRHASRDVPTVVLHVGDFDPSGVALFEAAAEDVRALVNGFDGAAGVEFHRVAVTPEQITRYNLPTAPAKAHDKRSAWVDGDQTVQAEAIPPDILIAEVRQAVTSRIDFDALAAIQVQETVEGDRVAADIDALLTDEDGGAPS
jgi:hypothetical protein